MILAIPSRLPSSVIRTSTDACNLTAVAVILEEITDENREAVLALRVAPGQEQFVSSVQDSLAEAADYLQAKQRYQGRGYGTAVVQQIAELVQAEGATELLTSYVPGDDGPAGFYQRLVFVPTGELDESGEVIVRLRLPSA